MENTLRLLNSTNQLERLDGLYLLGFLTKENYDYWYQNAWALSLVY